MDILKTFDSKTVSAINFLNMGVYVCGFGCTLVQDNGPKSAVKKGQSFDGICYGRRKSGSQVKQHLKLIPVKSTPE